MYIDALNGKTVTRETLLRYTLKSHSVNDLIRGNLWETLEGRTSTTLLPPGYNLWRRLSWRRSSHMQWRLSVSARLSTALAVRSGFWPLARFVPSFPTLMSLDSGLASDMETFGVTGDSLILLSSRLCWPA